MRFLLLLSVLLLFSMAFSHKKEKKVFFEGSRDIIVSVSNDLEASTKLDALSHHVDSFHASSYEVAHRFKFLTNHMVLTIKDNDKTVDDILSELPHVEKAYESRTWEAYNTPYAWGIDRIDQEDLPLDGNYNNNWTGSGVSVYIVDTGIDLMHEQFNNTDERETANIFNFFGNISENTDGNGHGTHCAGSSAGKSVGVAPQANLYGAKVLADEGYGSDYGILVGLEAVYEHLVNSSSRGVVSMSLGGPCMSYRCQDDNMEAYEQIFKNLTDAGAIVSVAAGNEATDACFTFPAALDYTVGVGAMDKNDTEAYFSNYGPCVDIYAPGVNINSACSYNTSGCTTEEEYVEFSGTSMACPHVSGALATFLQANPDTSSEEIIDRTICGSTLGVLTLETNPLYLESKQTPNRLLYTGFNSSKPADCDVDNYSSLTCINGTLGYKFSLFDTFGDGWDDGYYYLHSLYFPNASIYGSTGETPYIEQTLCIIPNTSYIMYVSGSDYPEELGWYACSNLGGQTTFEHAPMLTFGEGSIHDTTIDECSISCYGNLSTKVDLTGGPWSPYNYMTVTYDGETSYLTNPYWEEASSILCPESNTPCFEIEFGGYDNFTTESYETQCGNGTAYLDGYDSFCLNSDGSCVTSADDDTAPSDDNTAPSDDNTAPSDDNNNESNDKDDDDSADVTGIVIGSIVSVIALSGACFIGYRNWYAPSDPKHVAMDNDANKMV